jgi:hypothetical protein
MNPTPLTHLQRLEAEAIRILREVVAWEYDGAVYRRRNEVERLFRRLKG